MINSLLLFWSGPTPCKKVEVDKRYPDLEVPLVTVKLDDFFELDEIWSFVLKNADNQQPGVFRDAKFKLCSKSFQALV